MLGGTLAFRSSTLRILAAFMALIMGLTATLLVAVGAPEPIQAVAGPDVTVGRVEVVAFDASSSSGAVPLQFLWFFGDGDAAIGSLPALSEEATTSFAYTREGVYEAILVVTDSLGRRDVDTRIVTVREAIPRAAITVGSSGTVELLHVEEDEPIRFSGVGEDTGSLSYHWTFGDGQEGVGRVVDHAYPAAGTYVTRLEVTDENGARNQSAVSVQVGNVAPVAAASIPPAAAEDEHVILDASATTDTLSDRTKLSYLWDLGDGTIRQGPVVSHAYGRAGEFLVRLTVTDDNGASSTVTGPIAIRNVAPLASLPVLLVAKEGATFLIDASASVDTPSDVPGLNYSWDFDHDGTAEEFGPHTAHVFQDDGARFVQLDLADDDGARDSVFTQVLVANEAPSVGIVDAFRLVDVTLTAGLKPGQTATVTIFEGDAILAADSVTQGFLPTVARISFQGLRFTLTERFAALVEFTPLGNGLVATPARLTMSYEDGMSLTLVHGTSTFHSGPVWFIDFDPLLTIGPVHLVGSAYDPGADPLSLRWDLGDGRKLTSLHPSTDAPTRVTNEIITTFGQGIFDIAFQAEDGDGGLGSDRARIVSSGEGRTIDNLRPRAGLGGGVIASEDSPVTFEATGHDTPADRATLAYRWIFRDGTEAVGRTAEHAFARAGTYHVLLEVTDASGETTVDSIRVEVRNLPPVAKMAPVDPALEDGVVSFDATASEDTASDLPSLQYAWDFGDGTVGVGPRVEHAYPRAGTYLATLRVQDDNGAFSKALAQIIVSNVAPVASFERPLTVFVEESVRLSTTSQDTPSDAPALTIAWALDDGTTGTGQELVATFASPGPVSVLLIVTDDDGQVSVASETLEVENRPPIAHIPSGPLTVYGGSGETRLRGLSFDTVGDQDALSLAWDFGDGNSAQGAEVSHTYGAAGTFVVTLTVVDPHGATATDTTKVNVVLDRDLDGLPDLYETQVAGTDPEADDTDGDGLFDFHEVFSADFFEGVTDPLQADTDEDDLTDWEEVWPGADGYITRPDINDTDGDTLTDGQEFAGWTVQAITSPKAFEDILARIQAGLAFDDLVLSYPVRSSPVLPDTDNDELRDDGELLAHSDPFKQDTDGDHYLDGDLAIFEGTVEPEDPTIFEWIPPLVLDYRGEKPPFSFDVFLDYTLLDLGGLREITIFRNEEVVDQKEFAAYTRFFEGHTKTSLSLGAPFRPDSFRLVGVDNFGNTVEQTLLSVPTLFDRIAELIAPNIPVLGPVVGGVLVGAAQGVADSVGDVVFLLTHLPTVYESFALLAADVRVHGVQGFFTMMQGLVEGIDAVQAASNPFNPLTEPDEYSQFRFAWYGGYVAGTVVMAIAGVAAAKSLLTSIKAGAYGAKLAGLLTKLDDASRLLRITRASLSVPLLLTAGALGSLFLLAELFPDIFGKWFDQGFGFAVTLLAVSSFANLGLSDDAAKSVARIARRAGLTDPADDVSRLVAKFGADATEDAIGDSVKLLDNQGFRGLARRIFENAQDGAILEARVAVREIGSENIEILGLKIRRAGEGFVEVDIVTRVDPLTGRRALIEVKGLADGDNIMTALRRQVPRYHDFDPSADIIVYVRAHLVEEISSRAPLELAFPIEVRAIPGT